MSARIRIAVVDDHPIFREGLIKVLSGEPDFELVAVGGSAEEAVSIAVNYHPDIILLDISMPGGGLEAARAISGCEPSVKIMMLTVVEDDDLVMAALSAGARGYVLKGISGFDLIDTIRTMQTGHSYISPELAARILSKGGGRADAHSAADGQLSAADRRILELVIGGLSLEQIAAHMDVEQGEVARNITALLYRLFPKGHDQGGADAERRRKLH